MGISHLLISNISQTKLFEGGGTYKQRMECIEEYYDLIVSNIDDKDIDHAMHSAVVSANFDMMKAIVRTNRHNINYIDPMGGEPLIHWANGNTEVINYLKSVGYSDNEPDNKPNDSDIE